jgi:hypothetical protein
MSTITAVTFDQPSYAPGQKVTMTVQGSWQEATTVTVTTPDGASGTGTFDVIEPVTVDDPSGRVWTLVSNSGTEAVLTATA